MGALMREKPIKLAAVEVDRALLVVQRAADAIDQSRFTRAVRPDQAEPLARRDGERNAFECDKAAEALAEILDLEEIGSRGGGCAGDGGHGADSGAAASTRRRPTKSSGF